MMKRTLTVILISLGLFTTLGMASCLPQPIPGTRPEGYSVPNNATPLQFYLYNYYIDVLHGKVEQPIPAETRIRELLARDTSPGNLRVLTSAGVRRDRATGEERPILTCFVGEGINEERTFTVDGQEITLEITIYSDLSVEGFFEFSQAPYVGWKNPRGSEIFVNSDVAASDAVMIIEAGRLGASLDHTSITPTRLAEDERLRFNTANAFYAREGRRFSNADTLKEKIVHEVLLHEVQHVLDAQHDPPLGYVQWEYRSMLRGMIDGDLPYLNIGRMVASQGMGESNTFRRAATVLLTDLIESARLKHGGRDGSGVEILFSLSSEQLADLAGDLLDKSEERFWFLGDDRSFNSVVPGISGGGREGGTDR